MNRKIIQIIIVEDNVRMQNMYESTIDDFNRENEDYKINYHILRDDSDVPKILISKRIDAIIIDLDWGTGLAEGEGNELIKTIHDYCRIPIFIVSGNLALLQDDYNESPILKKYQRDEIDVYDLMNEIAELYSTGYTKALGNQSKIDKMLSEVFWRHISSVITSWENQEEELQTRRILRFAVTRINEMLVVKESEGHDEYDTLEFYIKPNVKDFIFTGDIISYRSNNYIVVTASCDMAQDKSDYVALCKIEFDKLDSLRKRVEGDSNKANDELGKFVNNSVPRYHLLPPCSLFKGGLVDFQFVKSVEKNNFEKEASIIASINPVFGKDIQARFSQYYGRQGQPQLNKDNIITWIKENALTSL